MVVFHYISLYRFFSVVLFCSVFLNRKKKTDLGPHDWLSIPVPSTQNWLVVQGLEPKTAYQFSVLAQNKLGTGPFSEVVTVNTVGGCHF